jgi:hypothetical protein
MLTFKRLIAEVGEFDVADGNIEGEERFARLRQLAMGQAPALHGFRLDLGYYKH